jgi:hypothetical protein
MGKYGELRYIAAFVTILLAAAPLAPPQPDDAAALLANAAAAFRQNQENEKHWNWNITETRTLVNKAGNPVQKFPSVTSESVIRGNGRRCDAVLSWGDGKRPYLRDADPDARCQAMDAVRPPFQIAALLQSTQAKLVERTPNAITLAILPDKSPDKSRLHATDFAARCAAAIQATIKLDPVTFFPLHMEGEVTGSGCDGAFTPIVHYETRDRGPMTSNFRKGSTFRVEYSLQKDKFGNPANSFWISAVQYYSQPWNSDNSILMYWGRQFAVPRPGHRLIKEVRTMAQEFGAGSELLFK